MEQISQDLLLKQLREYLNSEKIKLWLPPYTTEAREKGEMAEDFVVKVSTQLNLSCEDVRRGLEDLRLHALQKLEEREKFQSSGLATLKVKLANQVPTENPQKKSVTIESSLAISGSELRTLISENINIPATLLKLICCGRVIADGRSLLEQGIKNGSSVMAMLMTSSEAKIVEAEAEVVAVKKMREAAELLSAREDDDEEFDVQIADQNGKPLSLPREEKRALTLAMTLHEKGRAALKNKKVSLALPLLLEADAEFSKCSAQILHTVDNFAILCLDIVWCYLLLKNLEMLPDAEARLKTSEQCFKRSYGEKMERLTAIKGGTGAEQALFMRLYLLQGIVAFHKGEIINAQNLFRRAEFVLTLLHIDEDKLNELLMMGFTEREARLALRAKSGNVPKAVEHIMEKRKEEEEVNKKAKKDWHQRVRGKKLGKTAGGEPVNVENYDNLLQMDFPPGASAEALRRANNDISLAIEILNSQPELRNLPDPESKKIEITDEMIQQVLALGFDMELAQRALQQFGGNIQRAVDELLKSGGVLPPLSTSNASPVSSDTSFSTESESSSPEDLERKRRKKQEKEELDSLVSDINTDANDYLDLTLAEEREMLHTYQGLLESMDSSAGSSSGSH